MKRALAALMIALAAVGACDCGGPAGGPDGGTPAGALLTVAKAGDGTGALTSEPDGIDCDTACDTQELGLADGVTTVALHAEPARDALFESWTCVTTRDGVQDAPVVVNVPDVTALDEPAGAPLDGIDVTCTARFRQLYTLLVVFAGQGSGSVSGTALAPEGGLRIDCPDKCTAGYFAGDTETLTATPAPGSVFAGWSFDCAGADPVIDVVLDQDRDCEARFDLE